mgnify:CR=1 FL=1
MKSRLTLNNLIAGLQTFFICMTLYAGEKGIMGYAGEKLILAIVFSLIGVFLNKKRVKINRRFKALIVMTCLMAVVITYSYFHSYCPEVTFPYWLRFIFVVLFSCICFDVDYVLKLCEYLQKIGVFIAVIYIVTWPVMGRDAGYLALWCGIANGAEKILLPEEHDYDEAKIIADIKESRKRGKKHYIIINAEGIGDSMNMAKRIEKETGMETRATILGHMQRGGSPTAKDRVYASIMGSLAVDLLLEGKTNRVVGYKHGEYVDFDIDEALGMTKGIPAYQYEIAKELAL